MSVIDQSEIDALLAEADGLSAMANAAAAPSRPAPPRRSGGLPPAPAQSPEVARLLQIRVPIIVELARRKMSIATARTLSPGSIIEFEKPVEAELDLLANNRLIGRGACVKVSENFGLLINHIADKSERIRSLRS